MAATAQQAPTVQSAIASELGSLPIRTPSGRCWEENGSYRRNRAPVGVISPKAFKGGTPSPRRWQFSATIPCRASSHLPDASCVLQRPRPLKGYLLAPQVREMNIAAGMSVAIEVAADAVHITAS